MANAYYYSSTAGSYTLTASITTSSTIINLDGVVGLPGSTPFKVVIDPGQTSEEIVKVTSMAGASLTVVRAWDGTTASSHSAGALVRHMMTAEDFTLSRTHEAATTAHGVTGSVVGTGNTQSLINKDLTSPSNTFPNTLATLAGTQTLTNKDLSSSTNKFPRQIAVSVLGSGVDLNTMTTPGDYVQPVSVQATLALNYPVATAGHLTVDTKDPAFGTGMVFQRYQTYSGAGSTVYVRGCYNGAWGSWSALAWNDDLMNHVNNTAAHGVTGAVVGTTDKQTLTNKTLSGSSNTFSNIPQSAVTGLTTIQSDVNSLKADTGILSGSGLLTMAAGWTFGSCQIEKVGQVVSIIFNFTRNSSTLGPSGDGNITNLAIATIKSSAYFPKLDFVGITPGWGGALWTGYIDKTGIIAIGGLGPNQTLTSGEIIYGTATYIVN